jgi:hypothetical protein
VCVSPAHSRTVNGIDDALVPEVAAEVCGVPKGVNIVYEEAMSIISSVTSIPRTDSGFLWNRYSGTS